jgi:hypothetical protein
MLSTSVSTTTTCGATRVGVSDGKNSGIKSIGGHHRDPKASIRYGKVTLVRTAPFPKCGSQQIGMVGFYSPGLLRCAHRLCSHLLWLLPLRLHPTAHLQAGPKVCTSQRRQPVRNKREYSSYTCSALTDVVSNKSWSMLASYAARASAPLRLDHFQSLSAIQYSSGDLWYRTKASEI